MNLLDEKKSFIINLSLAGVCFLGNLIAYFFLPDSVGLQIGANGLQNFVPKLVFLLAMPGGILLVALIQRFKGYVSSKDIIVIPVLILVILINFYFVYLNLK